MLQQPTTSIKTRGHRTRKLAAAILARHEQHSKPAKPALSPPNPIRVVCISDTHNKQPIIPPGDILIHAGDLTKHGSFDELQAGLIWLSSQPHHFKILVAGNHDVLLDEALIERYPESRYGQTKTKDYLDWGNVIYLEDSSITINVPASDPQAGQPSTTPTTTRQITILGSPWTPKYDISAFQYPSDENAPAHWSSRLGNILNNTQPTNPQDSDMKTNDLILITHGPPKLYLDRRDFHQAGCPYLLSEIYKIDQDCTSLGISTLRMESSEIW